MQVFPRAVLVLGIEVVKKWKTYFWWVVWPTVYRVAIYILLLIIIIQFSSCKLFSSKTLLLSTQVFFF